MHFQQLHITVEKNNLNALEDLLLTLGCLAITCQGADEQEIFQLAPQEECVWEQNKITALFAQDADLANIIEQLQEQFENLTYYSEQLPDQQWERAWLKDFKPMQFGNNTWICPTGFEPPEPAAINILLDPGLAFGTGTHPTTALCLTWIDTHDLKNKTVIDYGCGSGILAIAALKHGAKHVIAVDHDKQALTATLDNAKRNNIDLKKLTICLPEDMPSIDNTDIVLANILAQPLVSLAPTFADFLKSNGNIVLSGILHHQEQLIIQTYKPHFKNLTTQQKNDWLLIAGQK